MRLSKNWLRLVGVMAFASIVVLAACESDADRIRSVNEADRTQSAPTAATPTPIPPPRTAIPTPTPLSTAIPTPIPLGTATPTPTPLSAATPTPTPLSATIDSVDIQDGDCIDSTIEQGVDIESVVIVPCSGAWQYRVVNSFTVADAPAYPGENHFSLLAIEQCDRRFTDYLIPTRESWALRDRTISCLQGSFGLSASNPSKLDRLVGFDRLNVGECFNEAPETDYLLVELVGCSGDWEYRVLSSVAVADSPNYPGEDHFSRLAGEQCDRRFTEFFFPTSESWALGDRTISCLQGSFGLSASNPSKLDRLVGFDRLDAGECFNEAPETDYLLVEVVGCSGDWELRVVDVFSVSHSGAFPGDAFFQDQAISHCPEPWDYFYPPDRQSWGLGDREVICTRTP